MFWKDSKEMSQKIIVYFIVFMTNVKIYTNWQNARRILHSNCFKSVFKISLHFKETETGNEVIQSKGFICQEDIYSGLVLGCSGLVLVWRRPWPTATGRQVNVPLYICGVYVTIKVFMTSCFNQPFWLLTTLNFRQ